MIVETIAVALIGAGMVGTERLIQRRRREQRQSEDLLWREMEQNLRDTVLADPAREVAISNARQRAIANQAALSHLCQSTAMSLSAPAAVITVVEHEGQRWLAYYGADWCEGSLLAGLIAPLETSYCQYVVATKEPLMIRDAFKDVRVRTAPEKTKREVRAYLGAPVYAKGEDTPLGSLCVFDVKPRQWTERDQAVLTSFASLVSL